MKTTKPEFRVRFVSDDDSQFEECNGGSLPLTEDEYAENTYRACPKHPRAGSTVVDASTNPPTVGCAICGETAYADIPYPEYLAYYGNPDAHVYLGCIVEKACQACGHYENAESAWGIGFMIDSREYDAIAIGEWMTPEAATGLPGYAGDVARDLLAEAGHPMPEGEETAS